MRERKVNLSRIEDRLIELGWSDTRLGKEADVAQSVISRILSGETQRPGRETLRRLAVALDLKASEIMIYVEPLNGDQHRRVRKSAAESDRKRKEPTGARR